MERKWLAGATMSAMTVVGIWSPFGVMARAPGRDDRAAPPIAGSARMPVAPGRSTVPVREQGSRPTGR
jgi:hypothetical protein